MTREATPDAWEVLERFLNSHGSAVHREALTTLREEMEALNHIIDKMSEREATLRGQMGGLKQELQTAHEAYRIQVAQVERYEAALREIVERAEPLSDRQYSQRSLIHTSVILRARAALNPPSVPLSTEWNKALLEDTPKGERTKQPYLTNELAEGSGDSLIYPEWNKAMLEDTPKDERCECGRLKRHCKGPYPSGHQETER